MSRKPRWGDTIDDEDLLPPPSVKGPDDNGIKTITEYVKNEKGDAIKRTTKVKVVTVEKKVYKITEQRKNWPRFGRAATETAADSVTVQQVEEIPFERIRQQKATSQEKKATDIQQVLATQTDKTIISGSIKEMLYKKRMERELLRAKGLMAAAEKPPEDDSKPSGMGAPKAGSYVPPSLRNKGMGGEGESMNRKREDNSVRVTNLSEDVTEGDLAELFRPFGHVSRIFLAVDKTTGENRGFAFVNYVHREDAERAIRALNGYGYDNLILRVEWAERRKE